MNQITYTYNGSRIDLYLNEELVFTKEISGNLINGDRNLHIGKRPDISGGCGGVNCFFKGQIDDIQIWNVALDSSQVLMSSSLVRLDTSIPTLASVTLSTSNNSQNLAKPGDNLTLDFTVSEDIPQPTVNLAGHAVIPSNSSGDGKTWQAVYTVDNTTLNENVSFNIGFFGRSRKHRRQCHHRDQWSTNTCGYFCANSFHGQSLN